MFVLGTAGHVDHGKSSFLKCLTGLKPDRLPEEQKRGMTIDLNFVWINTKDGSKVGIVDVPGHHRFVKNMITGTMTINGFVLLVAADDGWMPQSEEHLLVLKSFGVSNGICLVTKTDLVKPERVEEVKLQCRKKLEAAFGKAPEILPFSSVKPTNLPEVKSAIDSLLQSLPKPRDTDSARIWIDRVFTPKGLGVVVTGTLTDGKLTTGDEVTIYPSKKSAQIKGVQSYHKGVQTAEPISRVAAQLSKLQAADLQRGFLLQKNRKVALTSRIDTRITFFENVPKRNTRLTFHMGTMHALALVIPLEKIEGKTMLARLKFEEEFPIQCSDRFLLRTSKTVAGGVVIDTQKLPSSHKKAVTYLKAWKDGVKGQLDFELAKNPTVNIELLRQRSPYSIEEIKSALASHVEIASNQFALEDKFESWKSECLTFFEKAHKDNISQLVDAQFKKSKIPKEMVSHLLTTLTKAGKIIREERGYRLATFKSALNPAEQKIADLILAYFKKVGADPMNLKDLGANQKTIQKVARELAKQGKVIALTTDYIFSTENYNGVKDKVTDYIKKKGEAKTSELRAFLNTSRKNAVMLLEKMDKDRVTYLKEGVRKILKR